MESSQRATDLGQEWNASIAGRGKTKENEVLEDDGCEINTTDTHDQLQNPMKSKLKDTVAV